MRLWFTYNFYWWPRVEEYVLNVKKLLNSNLIILNIILYHITRSLWSCLSSKVVRLSLLLRSALLRFLNPGKRVVNLLCTFSTAVRSHLSAGDQITVLYSSKGLTYVVYARSNIDISRDVSSDYMTKITQFSTFVRKITLIIGISSIPFLWITTRIPFHHPAQPGPLGRRGEVHTGCQSSWCFA